MVREKFTEKSLEGIRVLVISNALHKSNVNHWILLTPSAFDESEITAVQSWVQAGGSLLLIADHMPFGGAAAKLAAAFGVEFSNVYAIDPAQGGSQLVFRRDDRSLGNHEVTEGISQVATFTGSALRLPVQAVPLFIFGDSAYGNLVEDARKCLSQNNRSKLNNYSKASQRYLKFCFFFFLSAFIGVYRRPIN